MTGSFIPYGAYWCSPFARWQGSLGHLPSVEFAAHVTRESLASRGIGTEVFDSGVLGMTVPQQFSFYGLPWLAGMVGADHIGGPTIGQACATSARVLSVATQEITTGSASCVLTVTTDRLSNGPHLYYPRPGAPGGIGAHEDWVPDNMGWDPYTRGDMTQTAENCASKWNVTTAEQHEVVLRRLEQYNDALADDSAFLKRFMPLPFDVPDARFRKTVSTMNGDEGIFQSTAEGLAKLRTVKEGDRRTRPMVRPAWSLLPRKKQKNCPRTRQSPLKSFHSAKQGWKRVSCPLPPFLHQCRHWKGQASASATLLRSSRTTRLQSTTSFSPRRPART